jgi:hypothetical protein
MRPLAAGSGIRLGPPHDGPAAPAAHVHGRNCRLAGAAARIIVAGGVRQG